MDDYDPADRGRDTTLSVRAFTTRRVTEAVNKIEPKQTMVTDGMGQLSQELLEAGDPIEQAKEDKKREAAAPKGYLRNTHKFEEIS